MRVLKWFQRKQEFEADYLIKDGKILHGNELNGDRIEKLKGLGALRLIKFSNSETEYIPVKIECKDYALNKLPISQFANGCWINKTVKVDRVEINKGFSEDNPAKDAPALNVETKLKNEIVDFSRLCPAKYPEAFIPENVYSDLGMFGKFLSDAGKKPSTVRTYLENIRTWRNRLDGVLTANRINHELKKFKNPYRYNIMLNVLRAYGIYRNLYGDPRVTIILNTSVNLEKRIVQKQSRKILPPEKAKVYWSIARTLCKEGAREGIWIGLSLYGFNPSEFGRLKVAGKNRIQVSGRTGKKKTYKTETPMFLIRAMANVPKKKWVISRREMLKKVKTYGTTFKELYCGIVDNFPDSPVRPFDVGADSAEEYSDGD